jgi:hypothetical protein
MPVRAGTTTVTGAARYDHSALPLMMVWPSFPLLHVSLSTTGVGSMNSDQQTRSQADGVFVA